MLTCIIAENLSYKVLDCSYVGYRLQSVAKVPLGIQLPTSEAQTVQNL